MFTWQLFRLFITGLEPNPQDQDSRTERVFALQFLRLTASEVSLIPAIVVHTVNYARRSSIPGDRIIEGLARGLTFHIHWLYLPN